jgi:hypothetical protein
VSVAARSTSETVGSRQFAIAFDSDCCKLDLTPLNSTAVAPFGVGTIPEVAPGMVTSLSALLVALLSGLDPIAGVLERAFAPRMDFAERLDVQPVDLGDPVAVVQVELLPDLDSAESLAATLERHLDARGYELDVFLEAVPGDIDLPASYRVNIGPFDSFEDAERADAMLDEIGVDGFVRELEPALGC